MSASRNALRLLRGLVGLVLLAVGAELVYGHLIAPRPEGGQQFWRDSDGAEVDFANPEHVAAATELIYQVEPAPRPRINFKPDTLVYMCYRGISQPWFDAEDGVSVHYNRRSVRERDELCEEKAEGERRVLFLGDSITAGNGVCLEQTCGRLVEDLLRAESLDVRTVNCGAAGTLYVDEYRAGLEHRFVAFQPDVVVVNLTVNDLLPVNAGIGHAQAPPWWGFSTILTDLLDGPTPHHLALDPDVDWSKRLLGLKKSPAYEGDGIGRQVFWSGGGPQEALLGMRDWCSERGVKFGVTLWPSLQGIGVGETYPFAKLGERVGAFCEEQAIPFVDLLPVYLGHEPKTLWVSPVDLHGNPTAQELASVPMTAFVRELLATE